MAASRAFKLFLSGLFVGTIFLVYAYSFAVALEQSDENTEALSPTPAAESGETPTTETEPITHDPSVASEPCTDDSCSFEGVPLCSPPGRYWVRSDWLMWWTSGMRLPPLVTTSPQGTPQTQAGVLWQPGTSVLFGNSTVLNESRSGVRLRFGGWLDDCHRWGLEGDWMTLGGGKINYLNTSNGDPILARPFYNVETGAQDSQLKAYPGVVTGTVSVLGNDYFESVGMDLRYNLCCSSCGCNSCGGTCGDTCDNSCDNSETCGSCDSRYQYYCRTDLLFGYRNYLLGDNLTIGEDIVDSNTLARFQITDRFSTRNEFHGGEIGLNTELRRGRWSLGLLAKMAIGNTHQTVMIDGTTIITSGAQSRTLGGGIYAVDSNSGIYSQNEFTVIPQLELEVGYQLTKRLRTFVGYNMLYWASVMRSGDQIDLNVDPRNFPPAVAGALPYPAYQARQTNFWAQGINVGAEYRF